MTEDRLRTLGETMAIAVLKGDTAAAYALADLLVEEAGQTQTSRAIREAAVREHPLAADGFEVYQWPEFVAFCRRAGFMWNLNTIGMTIHVNVGEMPRIEHTYAGADIPAGNNQ